MSALRVRQREEHPLHARDLGGLVLWKPADPSQRRREVFAVEHDAAARDARTALYLERPIVFMKRLRAELTLLEAEALQHGLRPAMRLNGTSDLLWERFDPDLFSDFPEIQFFDYTKINQRMLGFLDGVLPSNYHLTFSVDACGKHQASYVIGRGGNVAVVFWPYLPNKWWGFPVIDGDRHDARGTKSEPPCDQRDWN